MDAKSPLRQFVTKPTTQEERERLRLAGFVHITGLVSRSPSGESRVIGENTIHTELGLSGSNNGRTQITTMGGEIWLKENLGGKQVNLAILKAQMELAPRGQGGYVYCSNGEQIRMRDLLARVADPDWMPANS